MQKLALRDYTIGQSSNSEFNMCKSLLPMQQSCALEYQWDIDRSNFLGSLPLGEVCG